MFSLVLILCSFRSQIHSQEAEKQTGSLSCSVVPSPVCWARVLADSWAGTLDCIFWDGISRCVRISRLSLFPANHLWTVGQTKDLCLKKIFFF